MKYSKITLIGLVFYSLISMSFAKDENIFMFDDYRVMEVVQGSLTDQKREDLVLLVKATDSEGFQPDQWNKNIVDKNRRGLVIFLKKDNGYQKILENKDFLASENEDGGVYFPPELTINLDKGLLYFNYSHGRYGHWTYTFRHNPKDNDFDLIGFDNSSNRGPTVLKMVSMNFLTGKKKVLTNPNEDNEDFDINDFIETWETFDKPKTIKLSQLKNIDDLVNIIYK